MPPMVESDNPFFKLPYALYEERFYGSLYQVRQALEAISSPYPAPLEFVGLPGMENRFCCATWQIRRARWHTRGIGCKNLLTASRTACFPF